MIEEETMAKWNEGAEAIREQLHGVAAAISVKLLLLGGGGGVLIVIGNIVSLSQAISAGRTGSDLLWPVLGLAFGALLTGYFGYLGILKSKLKRNGS